MAATTQSVVHSDDIEPRRESGSADVRVTFDARNGCELLEQRVVRFTPGRSERRTLAERQEVMYVVSGQGKLELEGELHPLEAETGVFVAPGESYAIDNSGPDDLVVVAVVAPEDEAAASGTRRITILLADQPELEASSERSFRYLVNEDAGCFDVTQFVGIVQPSKAPFHSHSYDEVGYVVAGEGFAHVDGDSIPLRAGSCFHLAPNQVHCIENSGPGPMMILGVFHPSGSPAARDYAGNKSAESASNNG